MKKRYTAAILNRNSWSPICGHYEVIDDCGHKHRTRAAAEKCLMKLKHYDHATNSFNSWYAYGEVCESTSCGHLAVSEPEYRQR